jgi:myo-inositol-1(or 4)-monophosphatase
MPYDLDALSSILVSAGKEELIPRFTHVERMHKIDGSVLTEADLASQDPVADELLKQWPGTVFLGEEMALEEQQQLVAADVPVWCLDPLDGTSNFAAGIPYFCLSLALLVEGRVELGIVYDPLRDECFSANADGAFLNGEPLAVTPSGLPLKKATALVDFKRLDAPLAQRLVSEIPYASQRSFGSVALDWCWLALGRSHVYLHGRSKLWDYAAGNYIFTRAGGFACTLEGESVFTQALTPRSSVGAVDAALFREWTQWLGIPGRR